MLSAIGRNKPYLQQYLARGMPRVLSHRDTETVSPAPEAEHGGEAAPPADGIAIEVADIRVVVRPGFDATHLSRILICVRDAP